MGQPAYTSWKYKDEGECVDALLASVHWDDAALKRIEQQAAVLVETTRARRGDTKGFQSLMQNYNLSSEEGLALMCLAEALLRIPDADTANALIEDKIGDADFDKLFGHSLDAMGKLSSFGLKMSQTIMGSMVGRLGMPIIRSATVQAMRIMGKTFVLGRDIGEAVKNAQPEMKKGYAYSYDMLGEGARTMADAQRYFDAYLHAIKEIGRLHKDRHDNPLRRPGISIKLSALNPRYDYAHEDTSVPDLSDKLIRLSKAAAEAGINLTVDAEEADRLVSSFKIIESVLNEPSLKDWDGYGIAVQAYQKRAFTLLDYVIDVARKSGRKMAVRLVKGAYWDSEIKRAQENGLPAYPVFTRKSHTDLSYIACAGKMLAARDAIYPMFGTHNAQTVAAILELGGNDRQSFAFQRLHGMGEGLHNQLVAMDIPCNIYAPVGTHEDLLAYLVRRLLENGANSSFVFRLHNDAIPVSDLTENPVVKAREYKDRHQRSHPQIPAPLAIYGHERPNSKGMDQSDDAQVTALLSRAAEIAQKGFEAAPVVNGEAAHPGTPLPVTNPANTAQELGKVWTADAATVQRAFTALKSGYKSWNALPAQERAIKLERLGDLLEENRDTLVALLIHEAGKTLSDSIAEIREAVDFCRYYAARGREFFGGERLLPGPTGERNSYSLTGRGVFVCISPWNFPLAIFMGQITAALMAGNAVAIKPAEQTPLIAAKAFGLMLKAGIPADAIALLPGDGTVGEMMVDHKDVAGVAFTGSTEVARIINRNLAAKDGPIVPLIAETGGLNAMIVDSTALPEQVTDCVIQSAFGSAGQRCSALRVLCLQEDIADKVIHMIKGAMEELRVGDTSQIHTDIGPVIDDQALAVLGKHRSGLRGSAKIVGETPLDKSLEQKGHFFAPIAAEIAGIDVLEREVFGPVLHIVRFKKSEIDTLIEDINATGYGLTFGLHSRLSGFTQDVTNRIEAGNIYVNRGMIGAVVGVQPFGGHGLSGTGPKAGGPYYLLRFANERAVSVDITASGGNTTLVSLVE